ncbi:putative GCN5-related N-acetyltransferase [Actinoplanes missouriensis 431]|uniref:Putative GCN5-related N-acetyltransferase n=1 Tax=Actinoplanes missouriensis (strain ATCC 14538 / DSM 43046 / CBS 188.64 / JCM 3121 / NBRC 102363 / NCIMB 12654 / NRRL B-3342 / UNCC 431) TaxID=512565 RepID=I0GZM8_ACTM4|nr:GNAT family N-acetyltransferase [Actinoplanes missouriensis]BAL86215.1 putative GCN5-related N-acetyltransferase [Actinoplanes missouriensis 431]
MTYAIQELVIRHVSPFDTEEITTLVAEAMWDGPVARWMQPDMLVRRRNSPRYFEIFVEHALQHGEVYSTADADGRMSGVALWFPLTAMIPAPVDYERRLKEASDTAFDRCQQLDAALDEHHPLEPHHYLAFMAVRPGQQNRGIGSALLDRHHARLDRAGLPAYLEANDPRNRDLYLRHGYQVRSVIELPDGPPLWCMWRSPMA